MPNKTSVSRNQEHKSTNSVSIPTISTFEESTIDVGENSKKERETKTQAYQEHMKNVININSQSNGSRPSSAQSNHKDNLRARYWSYLFDNLHRAVDEIYATCETDESTVECEVRPTCMFFNF